MRLITLLLIASFLAGCLTAGPRARFSSLEATREQFLDVSYQCQKTAGGSLTAADKVTAHGVVAGDEIAGDCDKFSKCMAKKGFVKARDGEFVVSKDIKLNCSE